VAPGSSSNAASLRLGDGVLSEREGEAEAALCGGGMRARGSKGLRNSGACAREGSPLCRDAGAHPPLSTHARRRASRRRGCGASREAAVAAGPGPWLGGSWAGLAC
jgi:hypothetical protein